jgi:hypothetical protein
MFILLNVYKKSIMEGRDCRCNAFSLLHEKISTDKKPAAGLTILRTVVCLSPLQQDIFSSSHLIPQAATIFCKIHRPSGALDAIWLVNLPWLNTTQHIDLCYCNDNAPTNHGPCLCIHDTANESFGNLQEIKGKEF